MMKLAKEFKKVSIYGKEVDIPVNTICTAVDADGTIVALMGIPYRQGNDSIWFLHYDAAESGVDTYVSVGTAVVADWTKSVIEIDTVEVIPND